MTRRAFVCLLWSCFVVSSRIIPRVEARCDSEAIPAFAFCCQKDSMLGEAFHLSGGRAGFSLIRLLLSAHFGEDAMAFPSSSNGHCRRHGSSSVVLHSRECDSHSRELPRHHLTR